MKKIFIFVIMSLMVNIYGLSYTALADDGIINVKDYGAAGNGVSDDTTAIKKALYYGKDKQVYFPEGIYLVSNTLTVKGNTEVMAQAP